MNHELIFVMEKKCIMSLVYIPNEPNKPLKNHF